MKHTLCLLLSGLALIGCGKKEFLDAGAGSVRFADADVSIDVGTGWFRIDAVPEGMCSPSLAGKPGLIQAYWARPEFPTIEAVMAQAKKDASAEPTEEKEFRSDAGVQGKFYSVAKPPTKSGEAENRVTKIVVATRSGRLLIVDLIGPSGSLHEATRESITRTIAYVQK